MVGPTSLFKCFSRLIPENIFIEELKFSAYSKISSWTDYLGQVSFKELGKVVSSLNNSFQECRCVNFGALKYIFSAAAVINKDDRLHRAAKENKGDEIKKLILDGVDPKTEINGKIFFEELPHNVDIEITQALREVYLHELYPEQIKRYVMNCYKFEKDNALKESFYYGGYMYSISTVLSLIKDEFKKVNSDKKQEIVNKTIKQMPKMTLAFACLENDHKSILTQSKPFLGSKQLALISLFIKSENDIKKATA